MAEKWPKVNSFLFPWKCFSSIIPSLSDDTQLLVIGAKPFPFPSNPKAKKSCWGHFSAYLSSFVSCPSLHCPPTTCPTQGDTERYEKRIVYHGLWQFCLCLSSAQNVFSFPPLFNNHSVFNTQIKCHHPTETLSCFFPLGELAPPVSEQLSHLTHLIQLFLQSPCLLTPWRLSSVGGWAVGSLSSVAKSVVCRGVSQDIS